MEKEVEEIRKFWVDPQTNRAWDLFADSSEAFGRAKKDIPALLSALEASQREAAGLREALDIAAKDMCRGRLTFDESEYKSFVTGWLVRANQALARTEKEGDGRTK